MRLPPSRIQCLADARDSVKVSRWKKGLAAVKQCLCSDGVDVEVVVVVVKVVKRTEDVGEWPDG